MITGVEIDMVVSDSVAALACYQNIFDTETIEVTSYPVGLNEAVFTIFGTRFHLLDENPEYQLFAPKEGNTRSMWVNLSVPDIETTFQNAMKNGCEMIQPVVTMEEMKIKNAVFKDPYGYVWMLHQIDGVVSFEERTKILEEQFQPEEMQE